jgi:hypothetical protein
MIRNTPFSGLLKRIFSVSDAHVGAIYGGGRRGAGIVEAGIRAADISVLKGDMFEGAMQHIPLPRRLIMIDEALDRWAEAGIGKIIHLLPGNHEFPVLPAGSEVNGTLDVAKHVLERIKRYPHIQFHEKGWVQLGDTLFTHGTKEIKFIDKPPNLRRQRAELPLLIGAPGFVSRHFIYRHKKIARQIFEAFEHDPAVIRPVNHIVYGHTHDPFTGLSIPGLQMGGNDVQFHNTGAAISLRPRLLQPLYLLQDEAGTTQRVERMKEALAAGHSR